MGKLKIGVVFGGRSGEHEVSLLSAQSVMAALDKEKYEIVPIGITHRGNWVASNEAPIIDEGDSAESLTLIRHQGKSSLIRLSDHTLHATLDVVMPILHGTFGEDGTIQGLLELADLPYVGAGVLGSAVGMDKAMFKYIMEANGLPIVPWQLVLRHEWRNFPDRVLKGIEAQLSYPIFTKPANLGSSVGISKCTNRAELIDGLNEAASYDRRIVVEQGISVRELEVAVLGNDYPEASVVGEIRPKRDFYDYAAKYLSNDSELSIPAPISAELSEEVRQLAIQAYQAIDCKGLGRIDFLLDTRTETLYINEINCLPGFTSISMYPKLWSASGLAYPELIDRLINLAITNYEDKLQNLYQLNH